MPQFSTAFFFVFGLCIATARCEDVAPLPEQLAEAVVFAEHIADGDFQSDIKLQIVELSIGADRLEAAETVALSIPDYRRGVALARVAAGWGKKGEKEKANALADIALQSPKQTHAWMDETIKAEIAVALALAGENEKSGVVVAQLQDESARMLAHSRIAVEAVRRGEPFDGIFLKVDTANPKIMPETLPAVRALVDMAEIKWSGSNGPDALVEVQKLCSQALEIIQKAKVPAGEELLALGILYRKTGDKKLSTQAIGKALAQMPVGSDMHSWRAGTFSKLVQLYAEAGQRETVEKMFEAARAGIAKEHRFYQPLSLCHVAEAKLAIGEAEKADALWVDAVGIAQDNPNPDSQWMGYAQVAISLFRCNHKQPEKVAALFQKLTPAGTKISTAK